MCGARVYIAGETQSTPSPPIWIRPSVSRCIHVAITWQPMPACACDPAGTRVEVLCGQPAQKEGKGGKIDPQVPPVERGKARGQPGSHDLDQPRRPQLARRADQRRALRV